MSLGFPELPGVAGVLEAGVREGIAPAAAAAVLRHGELVHRGSWGAAELAPARRELEGGELFDTASLTKVAVTATAAALLVAEGRLSLDEPLARYLPGFEASGKERVTVRELLAHSSGLPAWRAYYERARSDPEAGPAFLPPGKRPQRLAGAFARGRALVRQATCAEPLEAPPGTRSLYGDPAFLALGFAIEGVAGSSLDAFFADRVARPLGLEDAIFVDEARRGEGRAPPRRFAATERCEHRGEVNCGAVNDDNAYAVGGVAGHAGLFATAADLARIGGAWLGALAGRPGILDPAVAREFARRDGIPGSTRALGWDTPTPGRSALGSRLGRGPKGALGHLGYTGCSIWLDLDRDLACVLLTNHVHPDGRRPAEILGFRQRFHDAVGEAVGA